jgi:hypothetical protein
VTGATDLTATQVPASQLADKVDEKRMSGFVLVMAMVIGSIGATMLFVGSVISMATAFGNRQYFMGILLLLFFPASLLYCALNRDKAAYPGKLVYTGAVLLIGGLVAIGLTLFKMAR